MTAEPERTTELMERLMSVTDTPITEKELAEAEKSAKQKLRRIIASEGDADGARLEKWYLDELIAEALASSRMAALTQTTARLFQELRTHDDEWGQKKTARDTNTEPSSKFPYIPIVS